MATSAKDWLVELRRLGEEYPRLSKEQLRSAVRDKLLLSRADMPDNIVDGVFRFLRPDDDGHVTFESLIRFVASPPDLPNALYADIDVRRALGGVFAVCQQLGSPCPEEVQPIVQYTIPLRHMVSPTCLHTCLHMSAQMSVNR